MPTDAVSAGLVREEHRGMDLKHRLSWSLKLKTRGFFKLTLKIWTWYFSRFSLSIKSVLPFQEVWKGEKPPPNFNVQMVKRLYDFFRDKLWEQQTILQYNWEIRKQNLQQLCAASWRHRSMCCERSGFAPKKSQKRKDIE